MKPTSIVKPQIRVAGETHILEAIFEDKTKDLPEMKSVGYMRINQSSNNWLSYTITTKGNEVLSIEVGEPNLRAIVEDEAKIAFVNSFMNQE